MKILSIDTSTSVGGAAIIDSDNGLIGEIRMNLHSRRRQTYSEQLLPSIDYLLKSVKTSIHEINLYAVVTGPGSFTGLRVGVSTVKGFVFSSPAPVVAISSLEALAGNFLFSRYPVCSIIDARREEVYGAVFGFQDKDHIIMIDPGIYRIDKLLGLLHGEIIFTGDASITYREAIKEMFGERAHFAPPDRIHISPAVVARIGSEKAYREEFTKSEELRPLYMKRPAAEEKFRNERHHTGHVRR